MDGLHLTPLPHRHEQGEVVVEARLEGGAGVPAATMRFGVPEAHASSLSASHDGLLIEALFHAMHQGQPLQVHGRISPRLLAGIDAYMALWHEWMPDVYRPVDIEADEVVETDSARGPTCMTFSGGLDSCHTAWRHRRDAGDGERDDLVAGIFIDGLEQGLSDRSRFRAARLRNQRLLDDLGMELITVSLNHRQFYARNRRALYAWGAAAIASQQLLSGRFSTGLFASGAAYRRPVAPTISNWVLDPLLSTGAMSIVHDGAEWIRWEKALHLTQWPQSLRWMRVCFDGDDEAENCGRCAKCMRTTLAFRLHGLPPPPALRHDPSDAELRAVKVRSDNEYVGMTNIIQGAEAFGRGGESWVRALRSAVRPYERRTRRRKLGKRLARLVGRARSGGRTS